MLSKSFCGEAEYAVAEKIDFDGFVDWKLKWRMKN